MPIVTKVVFSGISGDHVAGICQSKKYLDKYLERDKDLKEKKKSLIKVLKQGQYFFCLKLLII